LAENNDTGNNDNHSNKTLSGLAQTRTISFPNGAIDVGIIVKLARANRIPMTVNSNRKPVIRCPRASHNPASSGPFPLRWTPDEVAAVLEHKILTHGFDQKMLHR